MKKHIVLCALLLCMATLACAIPAKPGKIVRIQPDGTAITLQLHGDEFRHWYTNEAGQVVAPDKSGMFRPSSIPMRESMGGHEAAARDAAVIRAKRAAAAAKSPMTKAPSSSNHYPIILVSFSDNDFTIEATDDAVRAAFSDQVNQHGYSGYGATGSVRDYFYENSMGQLDLVYDVYGPIKLDNTVAYYGQIGTSDDDRAAQAVYDAFVKLTAADPTVNLSQYDHDGDGYIDIVFMYYAGYNEAEGAPETTIWPHKWDVGSYDYYYGTNYSEQPFDGVKLGVYACTSELKGTTGTNMCGIGTFCHEFSHTLGLPDFYDTDYNTNGRAGANFHYDLMSSGGYNNSGRTPPYHTAEERIMLGWLSGYTDMPASGDITIPALNTNVAYKMMTNNTDADGEFFVFECRGGTGWDAPLQPGLIVYHADKSGLYSIDIDGTTWTASEIWQYNRQKINANGSHPCFYIVPAADQGNLNYSGGDYNLPFPGNAGVTEYIPVDWAGNAYDIFTNIAFNSGTQTVTLTRVVNYPGFCGHVVNASGTAIAGATVNIYSEGAPTSSPAPAIDGPQRISGRIVGNLLKTATTDADGYYDIDLSSVTVSSIAIEVVADNFITHYESVATPASRVTKDYSLRGIAEPVNYDLSKFNPSDVNWYGVGYNTTCTTYGAIRFTAEELAPYIGRKIKSLSFVYNTPDGESNQGVYGIIDIGGERVLTQAVTSPASLTWNTIDLSEQDIRIPSGKEAFFGYGVLQCTYGYPLAYSAGTKIPGSMYIMKTNETVISSSYLGWSEVTNIIGNLLITVKLDDSTIISNYNYIDNPKYGQYSVNDVFTLTLVEATGDRKPAGSIVWCYDGEPVTGSSVTLSTAGIHLITASFTTQAGTDKVVELEILVK